MLRADAIDVFWGTNGLIPLRGLGRTRSVVTIHDLAHRFVPHTQQLGVRWKQRVFQPLCARAADRLVAVSRATAVDVAAHYGRAPDAVIEPSAGPAFGPVDAGAADATLRRLGLSEPYLLTVGTLEPRKNILALVEAYASCTAEGARLPPLVIAGGPGWHDTALQAALAKPGLADRIRWLGFVPTASLVHLYGRCTAFLMPSLYEGFGIPLLEAQLCRAPVVHGDAPAMAEAAGGIGVAMSPSSGGLRQALHDLARSQLPLVCRMPATIRNDAAESARTLWQLMASAWPATSRPLAEQLV
jgi:glycosyltransferase involved in cell wall biosynthesis